MEWRRKIDAMEKERVEINSAEKLFDLPISTFHTLLSMQEHMRGVEALFVIYVEQKVESFWRFWEVLEFFE